MIRTDIQTDQTLFTAAELIKKSSHAVVLTGAGISTPSGIPDFRSPGTGLWTHYSPMEVASLSAFRHDPEKFYQWLHPLARQMLAAKPNPAHYALEKLQTHGLISTIITQNIDGLLSRAGVRNVLEIHGTINSLTCVSCFRQVLADQIIPGFIRTSAVPHCPTCGGILKPDVILYEEQLPYQTWHKAEQACRLSDLMLVAGTSLEVMPGASLPVMALEHGAALVIVNQAETYLDARADVLIRADVADVFPQIVNLVNDD